MREHTIRVPERELHRQVLAYVGRRVRNREDAEDIAQEVMLRVHRHSAELAHVEGVSAWVYRIAANGITDHYRRASRREVPSGHAADVPEPELDIGVPTWREPATDELRHSLASCLPPLVERLSPRYRHALELTDLEGFSQTEAAPRPGALSVGHEGARAARPRTAARSLARVLPRRARSSPQRHRHPAARRRVRDLRSAVAVRRPSERRAPAAGQL